MCLGVGLFGFILPGTVCTSWTLTLTVDLPLVSPSLYLQSVASLAASNCTCLIEMQMTCAWVLYLDSLIRALKIMNIYNYILYVYVFCILY